MLTNNWYKVLASVWGRGSSDATLAIKSFISGSVVAASDFKVDYDAKLRPDFSTILTSKSGKGIAFGADNTPPTAEDYTITPIANLNGTVSSSTQFSDGQVVRTATITLTNNNTESVTIREVAAVTLYSNTTSKNYLLDRTVLDEPVTIPAGGIGQVVYTITFNYPV